MNEMSTNNQRHTITINHITFLRLKSKGRFAESYSQLIMRLMDQVEKANEENGRKKTDDELCRFSSLKEKVTQ
jgi:hypothetical protein